MPAAAPLVPTPRGKVDELFLRWLSDPDTQRALHAGLRRIQAAGDRAWGGADRPVGLRDSSPRAEAARTATPRPETPPPAVHAHAAIPPFHFPRGRPGQLASRGVDEAIAAVERVFAGLPGRRAAPGDMGAVAKACGCPLYWKAPLLFHAARGGSPTVSARRFAAAWRRILVTCHDDASRFLQLLEAPGADFLLPRDLVPFLQDVVDTHPGLDALREEPPDVHARYITVVTQRIFYSVNRSWSGRITREELRRSRFLQDVLRLEWPEPHALPALFSHAQFRVIDRKFHELDTDGDLVLDARDLARYADRAISMRVIERILSGAVTRSPRAGTMTYADFVWFLLAEEDKSTPTSTEFWFRCLDVDGDGAVSLLELEFFYVEQARRMDARGVDPPPFRDLACQMLDLVRPRDPGRITLRDLKHCGAAGEFFDAFVNVDKFLRREQGNAWAAANGPRDSEGNAWGPEQSEWDKFAAAEYEILVAEEAETAAWDAEEEDDA